MTADLGKILSESEAEDSATQAAPPRSPKRAIEGRRDGEIPRRSQAADAAAAGDDLPGGQETSARHREDGDGGGAACRPDAAGQGNGPPIFMMSGQTEGFSFGVLRRQFSNRTNRTHEWIHRKLHLDRAVAPPPEAPRWKPDCARHDVLLPDGVMDTLLNPALLALSFEAEAEGDRFRRDLVIHVRLVAPPDRPLHAFWERARRFAAEALVGEAGLPVILALHDPARTVVREPAPAHVHLMALARKLEPRGWGRATDLVCDAAHPTLAERWKAMP